MSVPAVHQASITQYLTFNLGPEVYGVRLSHVQEIVSYAPVSPVPQTPNWIRGVFNLRGKILPMIDLRERFGQEASPVTKKTCVLILQVNVDGLALPMGIVVDYVRQVLDLTDAEIEEPPALGMKLRIDFITGLYKVDDQVLCLLDIEAIFSEEELLAAALSDHRAARKGAEVIPVSEARPPQGQPELDVNAILAEADGIHFFDDEEDSPP